MNESQETSLIHRFKWFILGGCGLITFFICGSLALLLPDIMSDPNYLLSSESLFSSKPTTVTVETGFPTMTPAEETGESFPEIEPSETSESAPSREVAYVIQVIDGDTIEVFLNEQSHRIRYIGIDSPENGMPISAEATEANRQLVEGQVVELERDVTYLDQYGRLLRYVYLQNGLLVNSELVKLGLANAVPYPPDVKFQELLSDAEEEAKAAGIGLWAPILATETPVRAVQIDLIVIDAACSQFNAPGNDNDNKNEEFVCLLNQGIELVDLTGWIVGDEYGWIYSFPEFALEAGATVKVRSGCGNNSQKDLYWCKDETAVWNNDGDCVYLNGRAGESIAEYCY